MKCLTKESIREKYLSRRNATSDKELKYNSREICKRLMTMKETSEADHIAGYAADKSEVRLNEFIASALDSDKHVYFPRFSETDNRYVMVRIFDQGEDLVPGFLGIQKPRCHLPVIKDDVRLFKLIWLVPGLAFDINGRRLGRGKGYYDFLLAGTKGMKIGIGFDWHQVRA